MNRHLKTYNSIIKAFGDDWNAITDTETFPTLFPELTQPQADVMSVFKCLSSSLIPWDDPYVFENVVDAINGNPIDTDEETQPDMDDIMYAMYIMESIRPGVPYSSSIAKYIAARAMVEGLLYIPPPANIANEFLNVPESLMPIAKKISLLSIDAILGFTPEPRQDDLFETQLDKLQDIILAYRAKVDQSVDAG